MKAKFTLLVLFLFTSWLLYSGFSNNDEDPRWSNSPRTNINLNPEGQYLDLPQGTGKNFSNETRYISTPQGTFSVGPNFRVHPTTTRTQSETPITRHPQNPNFMFASANTYNVGGATTFSTSHYITTDGGVTFFGDDTTNFNFGDPGPMVMYTGRVLISYITSTGAMGAAYSTDLGTNWSGTVTFPGSTTSSDKNLSATDGTPGSAYYGRCYTVYTEFGGVNVNRIVATYSDDGGVTWSAITPISPVPSAGHHHQGCDVTVDIYGWVRVVYANCTTNGQNSTEDYLGWAESGNGGVTWGDMSDVKVNTNGIRSSDFLTPSNVAIRVNGFPRIDGDKTCNSTADDEYVVMAEKNFAPAIDNGDIVLMKTPDGGSSWTRTRVNQSASGAYEWCPAVNVDATGAINVCYYSTRNVPTSDSAEIYLSRSTDGGTTFVDVKVSDHKFKPVPISGLATGYQGDYIGITSGGAGKIIPYWCEQNAATGGRYQSYASLVDITIGNPCEDFSCSKDTGSATLPVNTGNLFEEYSGTNYWSRRSTASAYNIGTGSARFNSWSASAGTSQSLITYQFPTAPANTFISFDVAYAPWSGGNVDSLIIETSSNSGNSYHVLQRLWGGLGAAAGPLNTVFIGGGELTPTGGQWGSRLYSIPVSTNKIRLRAVSGFGNDIWLDNICVQTSSAVANSVGLLNQGMFISTNPYWRLEDTVRVYLARTDFPNVIVDSAKSIMGSNAVEDNLFFNNALSGTYYRIVKHRNAIETWSNVGVAYTRGSASHHNFVPNGASYGNNMAIVSTSPFYRGMFSGDVDQNGVIDLADVTTVYNDASAFVTGYKKTDVTGDNISDLSDLLITYNNNVDFVTVVRPPGAEPTPSPTIQMPDVNTQTFENDAQRQKYELTKQLMEQTVNTEVQKYTPNWSGKPPANADKQNKVNHSTDESKKSGNAGNR